MEGGKMQDCRGPRERKRERDWRGVEMEVDCEREVGAAVG